MSAAMTCATREVSFVGHARLAKMGKVQGALFSHRYLATDWSRSFDGVIVFRAERPPKRTDQ